MVKRLRVDSARDMRHYLRHIDLPDDAEGETPEKKDEQRQAEREELNVLIEKSNDLSE